jgi:uncharacterized protein
MPKNAEEGLDDWKGFVEKLPTWFDVTNPNVKLEFWGGEPLVYWKTLKPLAEALKALMPDASMLMITNGTLLTLEINHWLDAMDFHIGISHDGVGQKFRGADPLEDPEKLAVIRDLYTRLHPRKRISFNAMLHKDNQSRMAIVDYFTERFGEDVRIGEGVLIHAGSDYSVGMSLGDLESQYAYRAQAFKELRSQEAMNTTLVGTKIWDFIRSIRTARPSSALHQQCHMDCSHKVAVDLKGNVLTCQNVSAKSHKIGTVDELDKVQLVGVTHWAQRRDCPSCPVLQLCRGACMQLQGEQWEATCRNAFSDHVVFMAAAIEILTGGIPFLIEGEDRFYWVFGDCSV